MSAKKTEILKLEKSLRVKKKFGNSSEDKVILSFAVAFALLDLLFELLVIRSVEYVGARCLVGRNFPLLAIVIDAIYA